MVKQRFLTDFLKHSKRVHISPQVDPSPWLHQLLVQPTKNDEDVLSVKKYPVQKRICPSDNGVSNSVNAKSMKCAVVFSTTFENQCPDLIRNDLKKRTRDLSDSISQKTPSPQSYRSSFTSESQAILGIDIESIFEETDVTGNHNQSALGGQRGCCTPKAVNMSSTKTLRSSSKLHTTPISQKRAKRMVLSEEARPISRNATRKVKRFFLKIHPEGMFDHVTLSLPMLETYFKARLPRFSAVACPLAIKNHAEHVNMAQQCLYELGNVSGKRPVLSISMDSKAWTNTIHTKEKPEVKRPVSAFSRKSPSQKSNFVGELIPIVICAPEDLKELSPPIEVVMAIAKRGLILSPSFYEGLTSFPPPLEDLSALEPRGVPSFQKRLSSFSPIRGMTFMLTGQFSTPSSTEICTVITSLGGVVSSVATNDLSGRSNCDVVLCGSLVCIPESVSLASVDEEGKFLVYWRKFNNNTSIGSSVVADYTPLRDKSPGHTPFRVQMDKEKNGFITPLKGKVFVSHHWLLQTILSWRLQVPCMYVPLVARINASKRASIS